MMETLGQYLRRRREEQQISLDTVALRTRIQAGHLEAIEADQWDRIPHSVSAKGFIRSYAEFLRLDPTETLKRFPAFLSEPAPPKRPDFYDAPEVYMGQVGHPSTLRSSPSRFLRAALKGMVGFLILTLFLAWLSHRNRIFSLAPADPLKTEQAVVEPEVLSSLPVEPISPPVIPEPENPAPYEATPIAPPSITPVAMQAISLSAVPPLAPKVSLSKPSASRSLNQPATEVPSQVPSPLLPPPPSSETIIEKPVKRSNMQILALEADAVTWVKLVIDNRTTKDVLLQPGDKVTWEAADTFRITVGNAGGVRAFFNGRSLGRMGDPDEVIRDRLFTREGYPVEAPQKPTEPQRIDKEEPF